MMNKVFKIIDIDTRYSEIEKFINNESLEIEESFLLKCLNDKFHLIRCEALDCIINNNFEYDFCDFIEEKISFEKDLACLSRSVFILTLTKENNSVNNILFESINLAEISYLNIWYESALYIKTKNLILLERIKSFSNYGDNFLSDISHSLLDTINRKLK